MKTLYLAVAPSLLLALIWPILGAAQWWNSTPQHARSAPSRSRQRTPSSTAQGCLGISIVVDLVF